MKMYDYECHRGYTRVTDEAVCGLVFESLDEPNEHGEVRCPRCTCWAKRLMPAPMLKDVG